jgi:multidrug efflux pump subunit AcrA (membrane-fusion protein)
MPTASWDHLERAIERLHAAAREPLAVREFYRELTREAIGALDAAGGAAWRAGTSGRPEIICQTLPDDGVEPDWSARVAVVEQSLAGSAARIVERGGEHDVLLCPVSPPAGGDATNAPLAVLELLMPHGASSPVRQGWLDFAAALADVAADFHAREELRRLRNSGSVQGQAVELLRRVGAERSLEEAAFAVANEGRRILGCDRVTVLVRRRERMVLCAVSGVDATPRGGEFARIGERLADEIAAWGEPIEGSQTTVDGSELPPRLGESLELFLDHGHARGLACVPLRFEATTSSEGHQRFDAVLLAERFAMGGALREPLVELGELCAPALSRAAELDRFPVGLARRWADRLAALRAPARLNRTAAIALGILSGVLALVVLPADLTVEAPARLAAVVEREVFATASGAVDRVLVTHGQHVAEGDVLIVLRDPELALKLQEVRGAIAAARERASAMAVTRTDRTIRDEPSADRLPLAAEQQEVEARLASLERQLVLLEQRREALTLRSPCAGEVLTRDVQTLLASRPVERGQALLTIADGSSGWELRADVAQRSIGHVVEAQQSAAAPLVISYRLAGDVRSTYAGHVMAVSAAAPLDADGLRDEPAPTEVRIATDGTAPTVARPGMAATVRIGCGRRSLGYVWLHDVAATIYRWLTF